MLMHQIPSEPRSIKCTFDKKIYSLLHAEKKQRERKEKSEMKKTGVSSAAYCVQEGICIEREKRKYREGQKKRDENEGNIIATIMLLPFSQLSSCCCITPMLLFSLSLPSVSLRSPTSSTDLSPLLDLETAAGYLLDVIFPSVLSDPSRCWLGEIQQLPPSLVYGLIDCSLFSVISPLPPPDL